MYVPPVNEACDNFFFDVVVVVLLVEEAAAAAAVVATVAVLSLLPLDDGDESRLRLRSSTSTSDIFDLFE